MHIGICKNNPLLIFLAFSYKSPSKNAADRAVTYGYKKNYMLGFLFYNRIDNRADEKTGEYL